MTTINVSRISCSSSTFLLAHVEHLEFSTKTTTTTTTVTTTAKYISIKRETGSEELRLSKAISGHLLMTSHSPKKLFHYRKPKCNIKGNVTSRMNH